MQKISNKFLASLMYFFSPIVKIIITIAIFFTMFIPAQENENFNAELAEKIIISFRPVEKSYQLGSPVSFQFTVYNLFLENTFSFRHFPNSFIQFDLIIKEKNNQNPYATISWDAYRYNRDSNNFALITGQNAKGISLGFQESFSGTVDIHSFFEFTRPGDYVIEGFFYPLGNTENQSKNYKIAIKPFQFTLKNPLFNSLQDRTLFSENNQENPSLLASTTTSHRFPRALMERHILSLQEKNWESYLATLDLPALLRNSYNNTIFYERYQGALAEEKIHILEDFKYFLIQNITYEIDENVILKTIIDKNEEAQVEIYYSLRDSFERFSTILNETTNQEEQVWLKEDDKKFVKNYLYTYNLKNNKGNWKITAIDTRIVEALPSEVNQEAEPLISVEELNQLELIGNVLFPTGIDVIPAQYFEFLDNLVLYLKANPFYKVRLEGNTDNVGGDEDNLDLSRRRALNVYQYLINNGVEEVRVNFTFNGSSKPITENRSEEERSLNRRVEVFLFQ